MFSMVLLAFPPHSSTLVCNWGSICFDGIVVVESTSLVVIKNESMEWR